MSALASARYLMMDNVIRPNAEPLKKGTVVPLAELTATCDLNHLLKVKAVKPWGGNSLRVSDLLLRKDNPSSEEYQEEIGRLQEVLETLEAENEGLRRTPPEAPSKMAPANHILAEQVAELEVENARLKRSLRDAQEQRSAAQGRADKYLEALKLAGKDGEAALELSEAPLAAAGSGADLMDDVGRPAPSERRRIEDERSEVAKPIAAISRRYKDAETERREIDAEASLDLLSVPDSGPGAPIRKA